MRLLKLADEVYELQGWEPPPKKVTDGHAGTRASGKKADVTSPAKGRPGGPAGMKPKAG